MMYRIVRRAFSAYTEVETFEGTRLEACLHADKLQRERRDGEYFERAPGEPYKFDGPVVNVFD